MSTRNICGTVNELINMMWELRLRGYKTVEVLRITTVSAFRGRGITNLEQQVELGFG